MSKKEPRPKRVMHVSRGVVRLSGHSVVNVRRAPEENAPEEKPQSAPKPTSFRDRIIEKREE